jgi:hypothetical protein
LTPVTWLVPLLQTWPPNDTWTAAEVVRLVLQLLVIESVVVALAAQVADAELETTGVVKP